MAYSGRSSRAISTYVAVLLLMLLAVTAGGVVYSYFMGYLSPPVEADGFLASRISLDSAVFSSEGLTVYLRNLGKGNLSLSSVYIDQASVTGAGGGFAVNGPGVSDDMIREGEVGIITITPANGFDAGSQYEIKLITNNNAQLTFTKRATESTLEMPPPPPPSWITGWTYRKQHTITPVDGVGINYQVSFNIHYGDGLDSGDTVYLNNSANPDFGDIRFTAEDGVTELDYWIESINPGSDAVVWAEISGNLSDSAQIIYLYYGNSEAVTTSNGENTFIFYDDFSGDLSKWMKHKNGANIYIDAGVLVCDGGSTSSPYGHTVIGSSPSYTDFNNGIIEADIYPSTNALPEISFRGDYALNTGYKARWDCRSGSETPWMRPPYNGWGGIGSSVERFGLPNQWQKIRLDVYDSTFTVYSNDNPKSTITDSQYAGPGEISLQNHYGTYCRFDNIRVRMMVPIEPTHSTWGPPETTP